MLRALLLIAVLALTACRPPSLVQGPSPSAREVPAAVDASAAKPMKGQVERPHSVQALLSEIADTAIVSVIDPVSGNSVGATRTDASGSFTILFDSSFRPTNGQPFFTEVLKGVKGPNALFNQAGSDAIRLRTIVFFDGATGGWKSLTSATPDLILISKGTTALSVLLALRQQASETVDLNAYINAIPNNTAYVQPAGGSRPADYSAAYAVIEDSILNDRDPLQFTTYDVVNKKVMSTYVGFSISDAQPRSGTIGDTITITGTGFLTADATVSINGVPGTILTRNDDTITATVAPGSRTGYVSVQVGLAIQAGPTYVVNVTDGHSVFLNGKMYVANPSWGTLAEVSANGDVKTVVSGLGNPRQVAIGPDGQIYVTAYGDAAIWKINPADFSKASFATLANAYGLTFQGANLYVSSCQGSGNGTVRKYNAAGGTLATYTGFTDPTGLALDYAGRLYVVEAAGDIWQITPNGANGAPRTKMATLYNPAGIAIDSAASLYVASTANNCIYKVKADGGVSVHTQIQSPLGVAFDDVGNLFVSNSASNLLFKIAPSGNSIIYAYGISSPRGLAADPLDGTLYLSLYQSNAILKVNPSDGILKRFVTGIAPPLGLSFRNNGLYIAQPKNNAVSYADRSGNMTTVRTGLSSPGAADLDPVSGKVYMSRYGLPFVTWSDPAMVDGGYDTLLSGAFAQSSSILRNHPSKITGVNATGKYYMIGYRKLFLVETLPNALYRFTTLKDFANDLWDVATDAAGNVYVSVPSENAVYRFLVGSSYAESKITGFLSPRGLTFGTGGVLYAASSDGALRRVGTPASAGTVDAWASANVGAVAGLAHMGGDIYMTNSATINAYNIAGNSSALYVTMPAGVSYIWAKPDGTLIAYSDYTYTYQVSPPASGKVPSPYINMYGWGRNVANGFDENWNLSRTINSWSSYINDADIGHLAYTGEIAYDDNKLYLCTTGKYGGGGCLVRFDLGAGGSEYHYRSLGNTRSVALSATHNLYVGNDDTVYELNQTTGAYSSLISLGTVPWGLDFFDGGNTLYAVGDNALIWSKVIGGGVATSNKYGLMGPSF